MRFSRHAKNWARRFKVNVDEAEAVIAHPLSTGSDDDGKPQYIGYIRGIRVRIVVALDDPDLIVTIHERRC
jgi:hypothetical protein